MSYLTERYINLFPKDKEKKKLYADKVWDLLQNAYKSIGGLKGNGFKNKEDMIENIPFWKLEVKNDEILSVRLYKDKNGRKSVAGATNGTRDGVKSFAKIADEDLDRSYTEISKKMIPFIKRNPKFKDKVYTYEQVKEILVDDEIRRPSEDDPELLLHPELADNFYQRELGGKWVTKLMVGRHGFPIVEAVDKIEHYINNEIEFK